MDAANRRLPRWTLALALVPAVLALGGCGKSTAKVAAVEGIVRLDGQPLTSGKVLFQPAAGRGATGAIQSDGTFTLGTFGESDGALLGPHKVAVVAYEGAGLGRPDPTAQRKTLKPLVPERYLSPGTSGVTFEVKADDNHAEIDLTTP